MRIGPAVVPDIEEIQIEELDLTLSRAAASQVHPLTREWGAAADEAELREEQKELIHWLSDKAGTATAGSSAGSFKSRLLMVEGQPVIASLRVPDIDGGRAFVTFPRMAIPLGTLRNWTSLAAELSRVFPHPKPAAALIFHPSHLPLEAPVSGIGDHLLAAPARAMADRPRAAGFERITLRPSRDLGFYPRYKALYEATYEERPALRGEVRTETKESLTPSLDEGFLFEIVADGKWAGIVAGKRRLIAGIRGIFMVEIVLTPEFRGQRLGAAVHQHFAAAVVESLPAAVITGTISDKNPWSLETALRAGRIEVGAWHWIEL